MGRLRFIGQEEVDIRLRTDRGRSPRRLVPWWARVLRRVGMRWEMCRLRRGSLSIRSSRLRFSGLHSSSRRSVVKPCLAQSGERSVGEPRCLAPGIDHKRMHQGATAPGQTRGPHVFLDPVLVINWSDAALRW